MKTSIQHRRRAYHYHSPDTRAKMTELMKKRISNPEFAAKAREARNRPEAKAKQIESLRSNWRDPELRAKYIQALIGIKHNVRKTTAIEWSCKHCGKVEYLPLWQTRTRKYCSRECAYFAHTLGNRTARRILAKSREWKHIRNGRLSQFCGICPITLKGEDIHMHHIDFDVMNNDNENLIPLWTPYHTLVHARAGISPFYEALDRAVLSSITTSWK